jgi:transcriptional regulator with XRE-family HTH domain
MDESVKERIIAFIKYKGLSQGKFEAMCGISNGYINNLKSSPTVPVLQKIISAFPDINLEWIVSGIGEMMKSDVSNEERTAIDVNRFISLLEKKDEQMDRLISLLENERNQDPNIKKQNAG